MADNITITSGTGVTVATDEVGGAQHQYVKIEFGGDGTATPITNAAPMPVSGTTIAITSLPDLGLNSVVKITSLPDLGLNSSVKITSLPDLGANSAVKITSLPDLGLNSSVKITSLPDFGVGASLLSTVTNAGTFAVQITSLPDFATGTSVLATVTNAGTFAVQITSLPDFAVGTSVLATVTNAGTFAVQITSLPDLGLDSSVKITSLPALGVGSAVTISNLASTPVTVSGTTIAISPNAGHFSITTTYTSAQTNAVLKALSGSTTAYYITDVIFANAATQGNMSIVQSASDKAIKDVISQVHLWDYGGMVGNFRTPIVLDTNSAICFTSMTCTSHSVTVIGYEA